MNDGKCGKYDANDEEADDDDVNRDDNGDDHLYKSSDPIGLQSLSAEPCSARNGVLQSASFGYCYSVFEIHCIEGKKSASFGAECGKWC